MKRISRIVLLLILASCTTTSENIDYVKQHDEILQEKYKIKQVL